MALIRMKLNAACTFQVEGPQEVGGGREGDPCYVLGVLQYPVLVYVRIYKNARTRLFLNIQYDNF
jgi:hypothetical protein